MTMRTGLDWVEYPYQESHLAQMNSKQNAWPRFVLDMPMKEASGRNYAYNSGGTILLAGVIQEAANMSVQEFADRYLFGRLGIEIADWCWTVVSGYSLLWHAFPLNPEANASSCSSLALGYLLLTFVNAT